jgi:hypothetical protein
MIYGYSFPSFALIVIAVLAAAPESLVAQTTFFVRPSNNSPACLLVASFSGGRPP